MVAKLNLQAQYEVIIESFWANISIFKNSATAAAAAAPPPTTKTRFIFKL